MNNEARTAVTRARAVLVLDHPFFGVLALRLEPVEDLAIPTAAVDGRHFFYNPDFFLAQPDKIRLSIVAHEVVHCVLDHIGREGGRVHDKWNAACDFADNLLLFDAGFDVPQTWLLDEQYRDMSAEHIYTLLPDPPPGSSRPGPGEPGGSMGDIRPGPAAGAAERAELAREWTVATIQAASAAGAGQLPASLERLVRDKCDPKVDWRTRVRRFFAERTRNDYSWTRPNRHMIVHGIYLPSLYTESFGHAVFGIDVSGSIDQPTLAAFEAEGDAFIAEVRPRKVTVLYCDMRVTRVDVFEAGDGRPFKLHATGGGGTAFKPVFDYVEQLAEPPAALVYLTDLMGPTNFAEPGYPVLWCCTTDRSGPWGETIKIEV